MHDHHMMLGESYGLSGDVYQRNVQIIQVGMGGLVPVDVLVIGYEDTCRPAYEF